MDDYSFILALFVTVVGLSYHTLFILNPADLTDKRIPAVVSIVCWLGIGIISGGLIPMTHALWQNHIIDTVVGISLVLAGATLGHILVILARQKVQQDVSVIAMRIYREKREDQNKQP